MTVTVVAILVIFVATAILMYLGRLPALLALPLMAILIAVAARIPAITILTDVIEKGLFRLHPTYVTAMLGAVLAEVMSKTGIAETLVKKAAELGGDRPLLLSLILTAVVALLFTTLGGLGAVIMVATIVFPILLSMGLSPMMVGGLFLFGMSLGGIFNLTNWSLYREFGLDTQTILLFAVPAGVVFAAATLIFALVERRRGTRRYWAANLEINEEKRSVNIFALLTPLVPLAIVLAFSLHKLISGNPQAFEFPITAAMIVGICWGLATTWRPGSGAKTLSRAIYDGLGNVAPAVALMFGIGMLVQAVMHDNVQRAMQPVLQGVLPHTMVWYVLGFAFFAPLALYRGPLNLYGMGLGIGKMMAAILPPAAVMASLMSVGQLQGVCDPTNTHNVWIANYLGLDVNAILKRTLPYVWGGAIVALIIGAVLFMR